MKLFYGEKMEFEADIGLEIHARITSAKTKLFSSSAIGFGAEQNSQINVVDLALPGTLPVLNEFCLGQAILTGLSMGATINRRTVFERKNYFYPDLPQGYQISQNEDPIVLGGFLNIKLEDGSEKKINLHRIHVEQDTGKAMHDPERGVSFIDFNRAGAPLMEIVTMPEIKSPEEAGAFIKKLRTILRYIGTCDGNMDEGHFRVDVNISVRVPGEKLGTRAEVKNLNSVRFVQQAIVYEIKRQISLIESGKNVDQETRLFDEKSCSTRVMRDKENAHDYRYFPDPDLYPIIVSEEYIMDIAKGMQELPEQKAARFVKEFEITEYDAAVLTEDKDFADFFEAAVIELPSRSEKSCKLIANWIIGELFGHLNRYGLRISESKISPENIARLVCEILSGNISGAAAKEVFAGMWETGDSPGSVIKRKGLAQVSSREELSSMIDRVLAEEPEQVQKFLSGKEKIFGYLVGQAMKASKGKGNPHVIQEIMKEKLGKMRSAL
ncbi:Asp-tRNA(Asn)/Glu-tRNA(Gln) amidotransferase subunit GatB [Candidatus Hydrogenosomobacter endosymbioticus]|uniref:Aspartyl/glutamyl-tRNA(Asn/Gln) amidotransferase subunit B n=1 Tax=Candidatus Hydrogenosomobacter endosymbioticus TaxID=2558174 RepID=A0ABN6L8I0_9PROT|nr:Asp-tRNA(Asn)/Glu-tRNA(Gln) amidotransferase subunit GatB [Candidatus Hydrogenosomobacter endosymbioticus]BDB96500.1 aspartyl/glutamyl-tRNA(Asn/Gln) amidotransferase subunit B [Candidatus Hydrogenosomobacter endosymbioticus]